MEINEMQIQVVDGELTAPGKMIRKIYDLEVKMAELKAAQDEMKEALKNAMFENGIKSWETKYFRATLIEPTVKTTKKPDYESMKEAGVYEIFVKEEQTTTAPGLRLKVK